MKKIISWLLMMICVMVLIPQHTFAAEKGEEMRAVWIATVSNIDFPKVKNDATAQKKEFIQKLDQLEEMGINTVMVQVRPKADALYHSNINPWSDVLTGVQGQYPGYDPLDFMIKEAHKRGMELHAWLNPYRITSSGTDLNALSATHPARWNPSWVMTYNNALYYNPEIEGVKEHIEDTVEELVSNYDIDGIHFDDYFYPSRYPLPAGETQDGVVANSRREHVNDMVRRVSKVIKNINPSIDFGISPMGIWKNSTNDPTGSQTGGGESYYTVYADTRTWIQNEWIDYVVPQIYWETTHKTANYETLVKWWSNEVKGTSVKLYIGQGIYKDTVAKEMTAQLKINQKYNEVEGSVYFSLKDLLNNRQGVTDQIKAFYGKAGSQIPELPTNPEVPTVPEIPTVPEVVPMNETGIVTTENLNVRSGPGTNYVSLGKLPKGESVSIVGRVANWYQVSFGNGQEGWLSQEYVQIMDQNTNQIQGIKLVIDGQTIYPTVAPVIQNGTTLVPLRIISENLGAQVNWNADAKAITIKKSGETIKLIIGTKEVWVGSDTKILTVSPQIIQGTTMVPIRFVSESLGAEVDWNSSQKIITIRSN